MSCLAIAILQDPLRKLTPHQPVFFIGFVAVVFGAGCLGAVARGIKLTPGVMLEQQRQLLIPLLLFLVLVVAEAFNSYLRFDNYALTLIGLLTYLLPFPSIAFAYQLVLRHGMFRINQFMRWYIICMTLAITTVYLEYSGYHWPILGQVGTNLIVYDSTTGAILPSRSGLFRASEIAGWHAMTCACFVTLLTFCRRITLTRLLLAAALVALALGIGILTGRRKVVIEFAIFNISYFTLWLILEQGAKRFVIIALTTAAVAVYLSLAVGLREDKHGTVTSNYDEYVLRTESVFRDAPSRFVELGLAPVTWAYGSFGMFGAGLGAGTQGTQYFGGVSAAAAEGGLGKIVVELGIPGLFIMGWGSIALCRYLWWILQNAVRYSRRIGRLLIGLCSFLIANLAAFSVATQAYGDLFILLILSWALGVLLAVPAWFKQQVQIQRQIERRAAVISPS